MGKALADAFAPARAVFEEVDAALGEKLTRTMWEGPAEALTLTENAQPALMAVSLAAMRVLEAHAGVDLVRDARFVAGHSLGEYSALAAAGALTIADTARLLRLRGRAMQKAVPVGTGAMAALLGVEFEQDRCRLLEMRALIPSQNALGTSKLVRRNSKPSRKLLKMVRRGGLEPPRDCSR